MEQKYVGLIILAVILIVIIVALIIWWAVSLGQTTENPECIQVNNTDVKPVLYDGFPYIPDDEENEPNPEPQAPVRSHKTSKSQVLVFDGQKAATDASDKGDQILIKQENDFLINMGRRGKGQVLVEATPMLFDDCLKECRANKACQMATYDTEKKLCTLHNTNEGYDTQLSHITLIKN